MTSRRLAFFVLILSVCCSFKPFLRTVTGDDWLPIDPADLKMNSEPKAPGAPAIYLYRQVDRKDLKTAGTEYNYVRIKILTEEGRKYATIEIPYFKQDASINISNIRARHSPGWHGYQFRRQDLRQDSGKSKRCEDFGESLLVA